MLEELDWSSEWMIGQPVEDLVHPNDDITWDIVDREIGASSSLQCYRRTRLRNEDLGSRTEEAFQVEEDINDDENIEDDFGVSASIPMDQMQSQKQPLEQDDDLLADF